MGLHYRAGVAALALLAGSAALTFEPAVLRDLAFEADGHRISVGAVRVPLWNAALAQSPDSFSLDNVTFTFGSATFEAKRIDFTGVTTPRAEVEALFSSASTEPMESRLRRISARQVTIPEIRVRHVLGKETQTTTYRNTILSDVSQGRIASIAAEASAMEAASAKDKVVITSGRMTMDEVDLPAMARLFEAKADDSSAPLTRIYGAFSVENIELADNAAEVTFRIASLGGRDFLARPTRESWNGTMRLMTEMSDRDDLSPEDQARLLPAIADFMDAFQVGSMEASGIDVDSRAKDSPGRTRIARIAYTGGTDSQPADMRWEGLEFSDHESSVKLASLSLTGFSFRQTIDGLRNLQGKSIDDLDLATMRGLIPTLGTLRLSGMDVDALSKDGKTAERVKATVGAFEITADKPINGIPTNIRLDLRDAHIPIASNSTDEFLKELSSLGYKSLDASSTLAATWNEATSEIALGEVSFQGTDMGSISLTGTIGNATKDLFSADEATAAAALIGAKAKSARVTVEDKGLFARYMTNAAKEQKTKPESLQQIYAGAAPFILSSVLGNSEQAKILGQAVAQFIRKPGKLTIDAQPKSPSGFGVMDAMMASDPKAVLDKLDLNATVE